MIRSCQQFDLRLQDLMDHRIDPETDEQLCAHCALCGECHESLMAYSLLHTEFLNDTDSMKIKLSNLGLQDVFRHQDRRPNIRRHFAIAASIAAMFTLVLALSSGTLFQGNSSKAVSGLSRDFVLTSNGPEFSIGGSPPMETAGATPVSMVKFRERLNDFDFYSYSAELPGIRPFHALTECFEWLQRNWLIRSRDNELEPDVGRILPGGSRYFSERLMLASMA